MSEIFSKYEKYLKTDDLKSFTSQMIKKYGKKKEELEENYNKDGYSILTLACKDGKQEIVKFLLQDCKLNPDSRDIKLNAGIHYAARQGFKDIIELLVDSRSDVNIKNGIQETPLVLAVQSDKPTTTKLLLSFGADNNIGNRKPLDLAREIGNASMISVLEGSRSDHYVYSNQELQQQLYQRLNSVEGNLNRISLKIKPKQKHSDLEPCYKELEDARAALDSSEAVKYGEIKKVIEHVQHQVVSVSERLEKVEVRAEKINTRVDTVEDDVGKAIKRFNSMEGIVKGMGQTQDRLSLIIDRMEGRQDEFKTTQDMLAGISQEQSKFAEFAMNLVSDRDSGMY